MVNPETAMVYCRVIRTEHRSRRSLASAQRLGRTALSLQIAETNVTLPQVSNLQPFEQKFRCMTRTNSATQLSLATDLSYRDEHHVDVVFANIVGLEKRGARTGVTRRLHGCGNYCRSRVVCGPTRGAS